MERASEVLYCPQTGYVSLQEGNRFRKRFHEFGLVAEDVEAVNPDLVSS